MIGGLFLLLGAFLVSLGGVISDLGDYAKSIFAGVGITLGLVGPLFVAERLLSMNLAETKDRVQELGTNLSRLDQAFQQQLGQTRADRQRRLDNIAEGDFQPLVAEYNRAAGLGWIDRRGLRVATDINDVWLLVRVDRAQDDGGKWHVNFAFEGPRLEPVGRPVIFTEDTNAVNVFGLLENELQQVGKWSGDKTLMPHALLQTVASSLGQIINLHTGKQADIGVDAVIELVDGDWAVTDQGLESLHFADIRATESEVLHLTEDVYSRFESRVTDSGLDAAAFRSALENAKRIYRTLQDSHWKLYGKILRQR